MLLNSMEISCIVGICTVRGCLKSSQPDKELATGVPNAMIYCMFGLSGGV